MGVWFGRVENIVGKGQNAGFHNVSKGFFFFFLIIAKFIQP